MLAAFLGQTSRDNTRKKMREILRAPIDKSRVPHFWPMLPEVGIFTRPKTTIADLQVFNA